MFERNIKRGLIDMCLAIAILLGLYYLSTTHFEFMLSLSHYRMFNISSISYMIIRFLNILFPIFLLVPRLRINKMKQIKYTIYMMGACHVLGSLWVIYFLVDNPVSMLFNAEQAAGYLQQNALNFGYLIWDSYDIYSVLFSMVAAAIYFALGYYIEKSKKKSIKLYWASVIISVAFPLIYVAFIAGTGNLSGMWLQKNIVMVAQSVAIGVAFSIASTFRSLWQEMIRY